MYDQKSCMFIGFLYLFPILQNHAVNVSSLGLCVVRIMLYAQEGNGILLSFNQPCTDHVGKLPVCNNSKKPKEQIYSALYFMMIYCYIYARLYETCYLPQPYKLQSIFIKKNM